MSIYKIRIKGEIMIIQKILSQIKVEQVVIIMGTFILISSLISDLKGKNSKFNKSFIIYFLFCISYFLMRN